MGWDDDGDWDDDPEGPSAEDRRRFGSETMPCPDCGRAIHDESVSCPHCGHWLENSGSAASDRMGARLVLWLVLAAILAGSGLLWWLSRGLI